MEKLIAACGLVCSDCEAYKASQSNDSVAIAKTAEEWSKTWNTEIKPEYVWCDGCMTGGSRKCGNCSGCDVRVCVSGRGLANCASCDDYGCEIITKFFQYDPSCKTRLDAIRGK